MPLSPSRAAALQILLRIDRDRAYAPELLHSERYAKLSQQDHGLLTELVMGVLRWRSLLDGELAKYSERPIARLDDEVLNALRLGLYQLRFLDRIPARAAINESVELVKRARKTSASGFVNGVLRHAAAHAGGREYLSAIENAERPAELASASAHPSWMVERWVRQYGFDDARRICGYDQRRPSVAIRLADHNVEEELRQGGIQLSPGMLLASARRVISGDITRTEAFSKGRVAIEDEGSQLVGLLVGSGRRILDCCAAPGGKTRIIAQQNRQAEIVAVELHPQRADLLRRLVNDERVQVITGDIREVPELTGFDRILVDAPCTGTGTLARNPEIKWKLTPADIDDLHLRQVSILRSALEKLRPGGRLLYATCSLESEENEEAVLEAITNGFRVLDVLPHLEALQNHNKLQLDPGSLTRGPYLRTLPGVQPCDGFFAAIIERNGNST